MYCRNCGQKIENTDIFCSECGSRIMKKKSFNYAKYKNICNKHRSAIKIFLIFLTVLIIYMSFNRFVFSEEAIISRYIKAYINNDYQTIVMLSGIKENEFINKKNINEKYGKKTNKKIIITNITENVNKNEHIRTVSYIVDDVVQSKNITIKKSGRKFLIFNNYVITSNDLLANNTLFTVPKNTILKVDNVNLSDKYIKENKDDLVIYKIPQLLKSNTKISLKLENGIELRDTKSVFNDEEIDYRELVYELLENNESTNLKNNLTDAITKVIESSIKNESFDILKDNNKFAETMFNDEALNDDYNKLKEKYNNAISNFKINDIYIENITLESKDNIIIRCKISYSYKNKDNKSYESSKVVTITQNDKLLITNIQINNLFYMFK